MAVSAFFSMVLFGVFVVGGYALLCFFRVRLRVVLFIAAILVLLFLLPQWFVGPLPLLSR